MVFSRFEKCLDFGNGAWIWDKVLEIVNALLMWLIVVYWLSQVIWDAQSSYRWVILKYYT